METIKVTGDQVSTSEYLFGLAKIKCFECLGRPLAFLQYHMDVCRQFSILTRTGRGVAMNKWSSLFDLGCIFVWYNIREGESCSKCVRHEMCS